MLDSLRFHSEIPSCNRPGARLARACVPRLQGHRPGPVSYWPLIGHWPQILASDWLRMGLSGSRYARHHLIITWTFFGNKEIATFIFSFLYRAGFHCALWRLRVSEIDFVQIIRLVLKHLSKQLPDRIRFWHITVQHDKERPSQLWLGRLVALITRPGWENRFDFKIYIVSVCAESSDN